MKYKKLTTGINNYPSIKWAYSQFKRLILYNKLEFKPTGTYNKLKYKQTNLLDE